MRLSKQIQQLIISIPFQAYGMSVNARGNFRYTFLITSHYVVSQRKCFIDPNISSIQLAPQEHQLLLQYFRVCNSAACTLAVQLLHVVPQFPPLLADAVGELLPRVLTGLVQSFPARVTRLLLPVRINLSKNSRNKRGNFSTRKHLFSTCSQVQVLIHQKTCAIHIIT